MGPARHDAVLNAVLSEPMNVWPTGTTFVVDYTCGLAQGVVHLPALVDEDGDQGLYVERIAALDLGKAVLEACVRLPHPSKPGRRVQEVRSFATRTAHLLALADWLRCEQVTTVVMESTSDYWKGVYYLLEAEGFDCRLANAREVKNVLIVPR